MSFSFKKKSKPFLDEELMAVFKNNQNAYNLGEMPDNYDPAIGMDGFFDIFEDGKKVGVVFFRPDGCSNIEFSIAKIHPTQEKILEFALSNLDDFKPLLPSEWFDPNGNYPATHWSALIKATNTKFDYIKQLNEKYGFVQEEHHHTDDSEKEDDYFFSKPIA